MKGNCTQAVKRRRREKINQGFSDSLCLKTFQTYSVMFRLGSNEAKWVCIVEIHVNSQNTSILCGFIFKKYLKVVN